MLCDHTLRTDNHAQKILSSPGAQEVSGGAAEEGGEKRGQKKGEEEGEPLYEMKRNKLAQCATPLSSP